MRVTDSQRARLAIDQIQNNRVKVAKFQEELSSGIKVSDPGDDASVAGTISQLMAANQRHEDQLQRISSVESRLVFQEGILDEAGQILVRAEEIATQGANETLSSTERAQLAEEVFQLRDSLVSLANSKFLGKYIYNGAVDNTSPYVLATGGYTVPTTGDASQRYTFTGGDGTDLIKTVNISDNLSVDINTAGNTVFDDGLHALERLGRALAGYRTLPVDSNGVPNGAPTGGGTAFTFPADTQEQTDDILETLDLLQSARVSDIQVERVDVAGRLSKIQTARTLTESMQVSVQEVLGKLRDADIFASASNLTQAQTTLEASLQVTSRLLNLSVLDFI